MSGVCKFFQTNSCRFGNKCRFRHVYEEQQQYYDSRSKPAGVSILKSSSMSKTNYYPQPNEQQIDLKRFTEDVALAVRAVEEQGIWPLSCFSCLQAFGNLDGFEDISPEELRWKAYEARATGKFPAYVEETQVLLKKAAAVRSVFLGKGPTAASILNTYIINGSKKESNPTANAGMFSNTNFAAQENSFGFNNQQDFRVQQQSVAFNTNIFAQALGDSSSEMHNNVFGSTVQRNIFGQPIVEAQEPVPSTFLQNHTDTGNDFFKQNIFASALPNSQPSNAANFFQSQPSNTGPFIQANFPSQGNSKQVSVNVLYSRIEDLNPEELEQYKSTTFTYGKTPLKPPPKELC